MKSALATKEELPGTKEKLFLRRLYQLDWNDLPLFSRLPVGTHVPVKARWLICALYLRLVAASTKCIHWTQRHMMSPKTCNLPKIIIIMSCRQHGYPWPSLATSPYHSSPPAGLQGYILCPHIVAVCKFVLVVLLLHIAVFVDNTIVFGHTNELRDYCFNNTQTKVFICSFEAVCSWCCKTRGV